MIAIMPFKPSRGPQSHQSHRILPSLAQAGGSRKRLMGAKGYPYHLPERRFMAKYPLG